jgi:hypothetical protein
MAMAPVTSHIAVRMAQLPPAETQEKAKGPPFFASPLSRPSDHEKTSSFNSKDSSVLGGRAQRTTKGHAGPPERKAPALLNFEAGFNTAALRGW